MLEFPSLASADAASAEILHGKPGWREADISQRWFEVRGDGDAGAMLVTDQDEIADEDVGDLIECAEASAWVSSCPSTSTDTVSIQAKIDAASRAGGGEVVLRAGRTYVLDSLIPRSGVRLCCNGATLQMQAGGARLLSNETVTGADYRRYIPQHSGYVGGFRDVEVGGLLQGSDRIDLPTSGLAPGQHIVVKSGRTNERQVGELNRIAAVESDHIILEWPLQKRHWKLDGYEYGINTLSEAAVLRDFVVEDAAVDLPEPADIPLIRFWLAFRCGLRGVTITGNARYSYHSRGHACFAEDVEITTGGMFGLSLDQGTSAFEADGVTQTFGSIESRWHNGENYTATFRDFHLVWPDDLADEAGTIGALNASDGAELSFLGGSITNCPDAVIFSSNAPFDPDLLGWIRVEAFDISGTFGGYPVVATTKGPTIVRNCAFNGAIRSPGNWGGVMIHTGSQVALIEGNAFNVGGPGGVNAQSWTGMSAGVVVQNNVGLTRP